MGKNFRLRKCYFTLSTGAVADMTAYNALESINAADNLLTLIVMEHFEEILKTQNGNGKDRTIEIIKDEVKHLIENDIKDPEGALNWFLSIFALQRLDYISTEVRKRQDKKEKKLKTKGDCRS